MTNPTKFRVQAGALVFEMEGDQDFVQQRMDLHRDHIEMILAEQAKLIKNGRIPVLPVSPGRRGRPAKRDHARSVGEGGRRPGRQPVIIRESALKLKPRQRIKLGKYLAAVSRGGQLGKDATVFTIAHYLCGEVLAEDNFTAGDINAAVQQMGRESYLPPAESIDVVQMLRNLAARSIGKQWVKRNAEGTFSLTEKGKAVGASGAILRPRGRRPAPGKSAKPAWKDRGGKSEK